VVVGLAGYRLWKYTIFMLGFILVGTVCAIIAGYFATNQCLESGGDASGPLACKNIVMVTVIAGVIGRLIGGGLFIVFYFLVIFCMGCCCGMQTFWYIALLVIARAAASCAQQVANGNSDCADGVDAQTAVNTYYILWGVSIIFGLIMGVVFIKLQKIFIIFGTSYFGSFCIGFSIFQCFQHQMEASST